MNISNWFGPALTVLLGLIGSPAVAGGSAPRVEIRDDARGLTFKSQQISADSISALQSPRGLYGPSDLLSIGFSAMFLDDSGTIDRFIVWVRHDGPSRGFGISKSQPLTMVLNGELLSPLTQYDTESAGPSSVEQIIEVVEVALSDSQLDTLTTAAQVRIQLTTLLGTLEKSFNDDELAAIKRFIAQARARDG